MIDLAVLALAKLVKFMILGTLSLVSMVAHSDCVTDPDPCHWAGTTQVAVVTHVAPLPETIEPAALVVRRAPDPELVRIEEILDRMPGRSVRIRQLAPPIRVEMMFAPDVLTPPTKDLNL